MKFMDKVKIDDLEADKIYTTTDGKFFRICQVEYSASPREDAGLSSKFLTWEKDYDSPDKNRESFPEFARRIGADAGGDATLEKAIAALEANGNTALPVYALYHGGVNYSTNDFHDKWDSCPVGLIYCPRHSISGDDSEERKELSRQVDEYDAWANGLVYCVVLLNNHGEPIDKSAEHIVPYGSWHEHLVEMMEDVGIQTTPEDEFHEAEVKASVVLK